MKKILTTLLAFIIMAGTVFGTPPGMAYAAKVELVTASMFGGSDPAAEAYEGLVASFMEASGISVQDSSDTASEEWKASIITAFNAGDEPDVIYYFNGFDAQQILKKVVDVNTIRKKYPKYAKDITNSAIATMAEVDGKTYAVPVKGYWEAIYCNKDLFDRYGLDLPTDWDKLLKAIEIFRENNIDPFAISLAEEPNYMIDALILSAGGAKEHGANPRTLKTLPDSWAKGLDMFKTFADMKAFPADAATKKRSAVTDDFYEKRAAMLVDGSWKSAGIIKAGRGDKVVVVPFPRMTGGKGTGTEVVAGFSTGFYITKKAWDDPNKQKAAVDFVNYMTSKDAVNTLMANGAGAPAANISANADYLVLRTGTRTAGNASKTDSPIEDTLSNEAWAEIWTNVVNIVSGELTAEQVLEQAILLNK